MTTAKRSEMAIPKWSSEFIYYIVVYSVFVFGTILAVLNLFFRWEEIGMIAACLWLAFAAMVMWSIHKDEGGYRKFFIDFLGSFAGKQFVESMSLDTGVVEIRFGFELLHYRFYYFKVPLGKIETVEWHAGQATSMAGHDMNDWHVAIWFDHDNPERKERKRGLRKPDQDVYIVGPTRSKEKTEPFGLAFVDFLRCAGATLVQGDQNSIFVRAKLVTREGEEPPC